MDHNDSAIKLPFHPANKQQQRKKNALLDATSYISSIEHCHYILCINCQLLEHRNKLADWLAIWKSFQSDGDSFMRSTNTRHKHPRKHITRPNKISKGKSVSCVWITAWCIPSVRFRKGFSRQILAEPECNVSPACFDGHLHSMRESSIRFMDDD